MLQEIEGERGTYMNYNVPPSPKRLEIELVSDCNLKCTYCPRHYLESLKGYMDFGLFTKIVDEMFIYPDTIIVLHRRTLIDINMMNEAEK